MNDETTLSVRDVKDLVLHLSPDLPADEVAQVVDRVELLARLARELKSQLNDALLEWLQANGELNIGTVRYYIGTKKKVKCRDQMATLTALLETTGGDMQQLVDCFGASAFKYGACRTVLGDDLYAQHFETIEEQEAKTGAPKKEVKQIDSRFTK